MVKVYNTTGIIEGMEFKVTAINCIACGEKAKIHPYKIENYGIQAAKRRGGEKEVAIWTKKRLALLQYGICMNCYDNAYSKPAIRQLLADIHNRTCTYCGKTGLKFAHENPERRDFLLEIDHKQPKSRGGSDAFDNLQVVCKCCNAAKKDMTHEEYLFKLEHEKLMDGLIKTAASKMNTSIETVLRMVKAVDYPAELYVACQLANGEFDA